MSTLHYQSGCLDALSRSVAKEKKKKFQGIVRVRIEDLVFAPDDTPYNFNVDNKKVDRLIDIFKTEGCDRTSPQNYIVGEISNEDLLKAMGLSGLTLENLRDGEELRILNLPPGTYIRCPKGRSRAKAIHDIGRLGRWWTVELYTGEN